MRFPLVRYFVLTSLVAFLLVAAALVYFQRQQAELFHSVQAEEADFFNRVQSSFAKQQEESALRDLLAIHEGGNVNLTRLFANTLWDQGLSALLAKAGSIHVDHCRSMPDVQSPEGKTVASPEKKTCFAELGAQIRALPEFAFLNDKVYRSMQRSSVFKIKVFDTRGVTIYSSEHSQVGDDKIANAGFLGAMVGKPTSELTHRDKFSAFEGQVENRDLISSYLPLYGQDGDSIIGVFEVYSDVTRFLARINETQAKIRATQAENQNEIGQASLASQSMIDGSVARLIGLLLGLLVLLFAVLYLFVRRADHMLRQNEAERERTLQQLAQSEKMASLGQMVAGVAHQLNTPLAFSKSNVTMAIEGMRDLAAPVDVAAKLASITRKVDDDVVALNVAGARRRLSNLNVKGKDVDDMCAMLGDVLGGIEQMSEMVTNLRDFTRLDRNKTAEFDLNKGLHNVAYIARSVIPTTIRIEEDLQGLPLLNCNASQLNQVFLNLINNAAQAIGETGTIRIRSNTEADGIVIRVSDDGKGIASDILPRIFEPYFTTKPAGQGTGIGLSIAREIVENHGGTIAVESTSPQGTTFIVKFKVDSQNTVLDMAA
ncbi:MAG: HAMP domain-containing histidine kinase [Rhodocyclaceae bacterium]|nr:HAMP domain-containing histidine kinase [Rhodocyclaceae bacterium]